MKPIRDEKGNLPETDINEEEFVRLVLQSLKDFGFEQSVKSLSQESGYSIENEDVRSLRKSILQGNWILSLDYLRKLNLNDDQLIKSKSLISRQQYLECLEQGDARTALNLLRNDLNKLDNDQIHLLSSYLMCSTPNELKERANWDGIKGKSRSVLLDNLQSFIQPSIMLPQRRLITLLEQAKEYQRQQCLYQLENDVKISLYSDLSIDSDTFPKFNLANLYGHLDEVWHVEFSSSGKYLATGGKDRSVIIWGIDLENKKFTRNNVLSDHDEDVSAISWSPDEQILVSANENVINIWDSKTGSCLYMSEEEHEETITSIQWKPNSTEFYTVGLDQRINEWKKDGRLIQSWNEVPIRITDAALTPDGTKLVIVGPDGPQPTIGPDGNYVYSEDMKRLMVYDTTTKSCDWKATISNEISSVKISKDSKHILISYAPNEVQIWSMEIGCLIRKYFGHQQVNHIIRSTFGGNNENFILSGSEDSKIYVWHTKTGNLIEILKGHKSGCVNSIAWSPTQPLICSVGDDSCVKLWSLPGVNDQTMEINADLEDDNDEMIEDSELHNGLINGH